MVKQGVLLAAVAVLAVACLLPSADAWGAPGHRVVARIADHYLSAEAKAKIGKLLESHDAKDMTDVVNWADSEGRKEQMWSQSLHYAFTEGMPYFSLKSGHCVAEHGFTKDNVAAPNLQNCCVVGGILRFKQEVRWLFDSLRDDGSLRGPSDSKPYTVDSWFAFKMLIHLIGDVFQPYHLGLYHDLGGNEFNVFFMGNEKCGNGQYAKSCSMHKIWDTEIIGCQLGWHADKPGCAKSKVTEFDYTNHIIDTYAAPMEQFDWQYDPTEWASESAMLCAMSYAGVEKCACKTYNEDKTKCLESEYKDTCNVTEEYIKNTIKVIEMQLFRAGRHLAAVLEWTVSDKADPDTRHPLTDLCVPKAEVEAPPAVTPAPGFFETVVEAVRRLLN